MFLLRPERAYLFSIKILPANLQQTLKYIENTFRTHAENFIFSYSFLDETFNRIYEAEQKLGTLMVTFTVIAVIIACLGLLGLISYIAERRTKEIGVRKVLGASISNIITLIVREFLVLVLVSSVIAIPVGFYFMKKWLEDFVYKTGLDFWVILVSASFTLIIAVFTVSFQAIKAAAANPVDSLRSE